MITAEKNLISRDPLVRSKLRILRRTSSSLRRPILGFFQSLHVHSPNEELKKASRLTSDVIAFADESLSSEKVCEKVKEVKRVKGEEDGGCTKS